MTTKFLELDGGTFMYHGLEDTYRVNPAVPVGDEYETHIYVWDEFQGEYIMKDEIPHKDMEEICDILFNNYEIRMAM
jgi:hypothetical protein